MSEQKHVLVVDDDEALLNILAEKLQSEGFTVTKYNDGKNALDWALKNKPDYILLDLMMPGMTGKEVLVALREDDWGVRVPVMVLSNAGDTMSINSTISITNSKGVTVLSDYMIKADIKLEQIVQFIKDKLK